MVHEIALTRSDVRVGEALVNLQRLRLNPLSVLIVESFLSNLTDVYLRIEVCREGVVVVSCIAVYDVEVMNLVELMLSRIGSISLRHSRVESASQYGSQSCLLELILVSPLPGVFEVSLVLRLVVCRVLIVASACQARVHDGQVLVRQSQVEHEVRLELVEEPLQLFHVIGVDLRRFDVHLVAFGMDGIYKLVALCLVMACDHKLSEDVLVLDYLKSGDRSNATGSNH